MSFLQSLHFASLCLTSWKQSLVSLVYTAKQKRELQNLLSFFASTLMSEFLFRESFAGVFLSTVLQMLSKHTFIQVLM